MLRRWMMLGVLMVGLCGSVGSVDAWGGHRFGGPRVAIGIGIGRFWGPFWAPYAAPVVVPPPVVVTPAPSVVVPPAAPPTFWYYCDNPRGYYPYVSQCPSGWRAVSPTPAP
jgi:hypothetical protein